MSWLTCGDRVLASIGAEGVALRRRPLLVCGPGREVAWCRRAGAGTGEEWVVVRQSTLPAWWSLRPGWWSAAVVVAPAGTFERWALRPGDHLVVRHTDP